jgi:hypothetical protein
MPADTIPTEISLARMTASMKTSVLGPPPSASAAMMAVV